MADEPLFTTIDETIEGLAEAEAILTHRLTEDVLAEHWTERSSGA